MTRAKSTSLWYPRYVGDYKRKTAHLSLVEHGVYTLLMDHYYSTGKSLPTNVTRLKTICSAFEDVEVAALKAVLGEFFYIDDGEYHHETIDEELARRSTISQKRRDAVNSRTDRKGTNVTRLKHTSTSTDLNPLTPSRGFDEFWKLYPHKVGEAAARKAFAEAETKADLETILSGLRRYIAAKPATVAWKNPAGWLKAERWKDAPASPSAKPVALVHSGPKRTFAEIKEAEAKARREAANPPELRPITIPAETVLMRIEGTVS